MQSTNYIATLITVSPDTRATRGTPPPKPDTIAGRQYTLITDKPYGYTSDDVLFLVHAQRSQLTARDLDAARAAFLSKGQACLRASPLARQYGWGIHHDDKGRVALVGVETDRYRELLGDPEVKVVAGMRQSRAPAK